MAQANQKWSSSICGVALFCYILLPYSISFSALRPTLFVGRREGYPASKRSITSNPQAASSLENPRSIWSNREHQSVEKNRPDKQTPCKETFASTAAGWPHIPQLSTKISIAQPVATSLLQRHHNMLCVVLYGLFFLKLTASVICSMSFRRMFSRFCRTQRAQISNYLRTKRSKLTRFRVDF